MILIRIAGLRGWASAWQNQRYDVRPAKTKISLGISPVWSEASLSHEESIGLLPLPFERTAKTDQTLGPMGAVLKNDVH